MFRTKTLEDRVALVVQGIDDVVSVVNGAVNVVVVVEVVVEIVA